MYPVEVPGRMHARAEDVRARMRPGVEVPDVPLLPQRNNCDPPLWKSYDTPLREVRKYVEKCGMGTMAVLWPGSRVTHSALLCKSWNCPTCRRQKAARLLDQLRRGMESRPDYNRIFLTLTLDPAQFGARKIGRRYWNQSGEEVHSPAHATRSSIIWSEPTRKQFKRAIEAMSQEWKRFNDRLKRKAARAEVEKPAYFRVVELHRNVWPHYHVVIEHPTWTATDIKTQLQGWQLGITDAKDISLDDAVAELAPYLVSKEKKTSKAYQFAASALPKNFRLYSSSQGFLAAPIEPEEVPEHAQILSGHFTAHHATVRAWGAQSLIALRPPQAPDKPHKPPSSAIATGGAVLLYYLAQLENNRVLIQPEHVHFLLE